MKIKITKTTLLGTLGGGILVIALLTLVIVQHTPGKVSVNAVPGQSRSTQTQFDTMTPETLVQLWERDTREPERAAIEEALLQQRFSSLPVLRNTVRTGSQKQKLLACYLLTEMKDVGAVEPLLAALGDVDEKVQICAALSLGKIGDAKAIVPLRKMLKEDSLSKSLTKSIIVSLGRLNSRKDILAIQSYLSDPDESIRVNAAVALAMLGGIEGQEVLLQATRSSNPMVQKEAIYSLGYLNTPKARNRLLEIISDPKGTWKSYAQIAIAHQDLSDKTPEERIEYLSGIVQHRNQRLAEWAIENLGEIDSTEAYVLLKSLSMEESEIGRKARRQLKAKGIRQGP